MNPSEDAIVPASSSTGAAGVVVGTAGAGCL